MPEGDSVWRLARRLERAFATDVLTAAELRWGERDGEPLRGRRTQEFHTHGKHLLHRVEGGLTLHTHLRMDGRWVLTRRSQRPQSLRDHRIRVVLGTDRILATGLALGAVDLLPTRDEPRLIGHLGPDLVGEWTDDTAATAVRRLAAHPQVTVGAALLDQRTVAGLGTIWVSETLWVSDIHPLARIENITAELPTVVGNAHRLLTAALATARPRTYAYGRGGFPCGRCGTTLARVTVADPPRERVLIACPGCQRR